MSKAKARVFVPLTKVDEEKRLVYGRITQEILDKAGEVMDYESSKPNFEKWSNEISEASGGLSKGNVRVMHGLSVAGKLTELSFDDEDKAIDVCAKVVDDGEWNKVLEGCYTGFSVGGAYGKRWTETNDNEKIKKFTAVPNEVSLVDNPCVPSATFTMVKADGAETPVPFKVENDDEAWPDFAKAEGGPDDEEDPGTNDAVVEKTAAVTPPAAVEPTNAEVAALATELAKAADDGSDWITHIEAAREQLRKAASEKDEKGDAKGDGKKAEGEADEGDDDAAADDEADDKSAKADFSTADKLTQKWVCTDGTAFEKKAEAEAHEATLAKSAAEPTEAEKLKARMEKALSADPVVEAPSILSLERVEDLHKAVLELELPREETGAPKLEKGMYTVSRFANMLGDVAGLARTIKAEGALEQDGDDESVSKTLTAQLGTFGDSFMTYAKQQIAELVAGLDADLSPRCAYDYYYRAAGEGNDLAKHVVELMEAVEDEVETASEELEKLAKIFVGSTESTEDELSPPMQKRFDEQAAQIESLTKVATDAVDKVEELSKRLKEVEDTPLPRAINPANLALRPGDGNFFGKNANTQEEKIEVLQDMLKTHGPDALALELIKKSHQNPIQGGNFRGS